MPESASCQSVAQVVIAARYGVLHLEIGVVAGHPCGLYADDVAVADMAAPHQVHLALAHLRQVGAVVAVGHKLLHAPCQFLHADGLAVARQHVGIVQAQLHHVAFLHLLVLLLLCVLGWRQLAGQSLVGVHRRGHKEEYQQHERDVGCRCGVQLRYLPLCSLSSKHSLLFLSLQPSCLSTGWQCP